MEVNISQEERAGGDVADIRIMRGQVSIAFIACIFLFLFINSIIL